MSSRPETRKVPSSVLPESKHLVILVQIDVLQLADLGIGDGSSSVMEKAAAEKPLWDNGQP